MASEAITRNDLTAILNEVLPPTPSEYRKLLWTNPSPTAAFAVQTISLDLSDYDEVEVYATFTEQGGGNEIGGLFRVAVGKDGLIQLVNADMAHTTNTSTFLNVAMRTFSVATSGVTFGNGQMTYNGATYTNWGNRALPLKIYGIKYVRVAPPTEEYTPPSGFGTSTDIASYTSKATAFTAPSDGFIWLQCIYTSGNYIGATVCNADGTNERSIQIVAYGTGNSNMVIPIFKGMKAWRSSNNGSNNFIDFVPYI